MSRGFGVATLSSVVLVGALSASGVAAQQPNLHGPITPVSPPTRANIAPAESVVPTAPGAYLRVSWGNVAGASTPSAILLSTWQWVAGQAATGSAHPTATTMLKVTVADDQTGTFAQLQKLAQTGRVVDVTLSVRAKSGKIKRQCVIHRAVLTQWVEKSGKDVTHPGYRGTFAGTEYQCTLDAE